MSGAVYAAEADTARSGTEGLSADSAYETVFVGGEAFLYENGAPFWGRLDGRQDGKLYLGGKPADGGYTEIDDPDGNDTGSTADRLKNWLEGFIGQEECSYRIVSYRYYIDGRDVTGWYGPEGKQRYFSEGVSMEWGPGGGMSGGDALAAESGKAEWHLGLPFTGWQAVSSGSEPGYLFWQDGNLYSGTLRVTGQEAWEDLRERPESWLEPGAEYLLVNGILAEGWQENAGGKYWYERGMRQGFRPDDPSYRGKEIYDPESDAWYWLDNAGQGAMAADRDVYQESYAGEYADCEDGTGKWVRYDADGRMVKGWSEKGGHSYYFAPGTGAMVKGDVTIDGKSYYFDLQTGYLSAGQEPDCVWVNVDGKEYWYEDGLRQGYCPDDPSYRGKEIYDPETDAWYWLDNIAQGAKAVNKDVYQESWAGEFAEHEDGTGKWVHYDQNGHMVKGWEHVWAECDDNNAIVAVYRDSELGGLEEWDCVVSCSYYFDPVTGAMAKGCVSIDGKEVYFDEVTGLAR